MNTFSPESTSSRVAAGGGVTSPRATRGPAPPRALPRTLRMADKRDRQATILELVRAHEVGSQEELRRLLRQRGWDVTQATLSRDLRELRLVRVPTEDGSRYAPAEGAAVAVPDAGRAAALDALLPQLFASVDGVGELVVLRTVPGGAQPIASALDGERWADVLGTIGGDDTILLVCRSTAARERVVRRLRTLAGRAGGEG